LAAVAAALAAANNGWVLAALLWWSGFAVVLAVVDVTVHRLPLHLSAGMAGGAAAGLAIAALTGDKMPDLRRAAVTAVAAGVIAAIFCLPRLGMGLGDAGLAVPVGLVLGWFGPGAITAWVAFTFASMFIVAMVILAMGKGRRDTQLPLGPFMLASALAAVIVGG
jgi:leader peptidase (prepilin peptidase) / N-methyltransferase